MERKGSFWRIGCLPLMVSLMCVLAGMLVQRLDRNLPPDCDFSCAMAELGWQDFLSLLLVGGGMAAYCVFALVCLMLWVIAAVSSLGDIWR